MNVFVNCSSDFWENIVFDYIVVGAGTTGGVIAARLSEDPGIDVLLLEAGGDPLPISNIPYLSFKAINTIMDWQFVTVPQKHCCLIMKKTQCPFNFGKALGGTSSINFMTYSRGNCHDFDHWKNLGNEGWDYDDVFPYFFRLEDYRIIHTKENDAYHQKGGPIPATFPTFKTPLADAFLEAGTELGEFLVDINGPLQTGFMYPPVMTRRGARCETNCAYIKRVMKRPNFHLSTHSFVKQIIFDDKKTAVGVIYEYRSKNVTVTAKREIIICAGAINSPKLLMLSGIGPEEVIHKFKIPVIVNSSGVGKNLQDHVRVVGFTYILNQSISASHHIYDTKHNMDMWTKARTGVMTLPGYEGIAFYDSVHDTVRGWSDIEIGLVTGNILSALLPYINPFLKRLYPHSDTNVFHLTPVLLRPKSRGEVTLRSANPHKSPIIDPMYLTHPDDINILVEALTLVWQIGRTKAFGKFGSELITKGLYPQCFWYFSRPDDYKKCIIKTFSVSGYNAAGTCKMGPKSDLMAVVDNRLRVYGVKGLRVADASIMPTLVAAPPAVTCLMIGEKAADMIKEDRKNDLLNLTINKDDS